MGISLPGEIMKLYWVGAFLLAGCVTPQTMRARAPDFTQTSSRSVAEIAGCIGSSWTGPAINTVPIEHGTSLVAFEPIEGVTNVLIEIMDGGEKRAATIYFRHYPYPFQATGKMTAAVRACL